MEMWVDGIMEWNFGASAYGVFHFHLGACVLLEIFHADHQTAVADPLACWPSITTWRVCRRPPALSPPRKCWEVYSAMIKFRAVVFTVFRRNGRPFTYLK